ncbi:hypothetical protein DESA109040_21875 [Deinococcus saxicola]
MTTKAACVQHRILTLTAPILLHSAAASASAQAAQNLYLSP